MRQQRAFTLIELVVVVVLLGILAAGAGLFITRPIEAYQDQVRRQRLVDAADLALRRIAIDVRSALPNSIRVTNTATGWALEMINTVDGARYRDEFGDVFTIEAQRLDFTANDSQFNILGVFNNIATGTYDDYRVVVYNTSPGVVYANASANTNPGVISAARVTIGADGMEQRVTLNTAHRFSLQSPGQRLFLVDEPISYICNTDTDTITRYSGYNYQASQNAVDSDADFAGGGLGTVNDARVASLVGACSISYDPGSAERSGLVTMDITLTDSAGESVSLLHQVHVDNLP